MRKIVPLVCALMLGATLAPSMLGQPVINEFMASNLSTHPDNSDFDDYSDWIELHNPANTNVSLANHFLTDDLAQPFKWFIPAGAEIPANGYLMFRADGFDAAPGETRVRGYWPWGSTFVTRRYHTGFKLSADGEAIGLFKSQVPPQDLTLIATGATWKYLDGGTNPGADWASLAYSDAHWPQGAAQLGYGDGDEATVVQYGSSSSRKFPTTHFRRKFTVTDPARLGNIRFRVIADDGAILYLNGVEIARLRLPAGTITHTNYANGQPPAENAFEAVELPRSLFRAGENVLAAEVHQVAANSSDLSWDAELIVSEISGPAVLVDSVTFGPQAVDISYGRNPSVPNGWAFFGSPTPEGPNTTEPLTTPTIAGPVTASLASGFYETAQSVSMAAAGAVTIRYTLDGSIPGVSSAAYTNVVSISSNTVLRARGFAPGMAPGPVLTRTYFVSEPADRALPVIALAADPDSLFGGVIGIYTNDSQFPYKGREVPVRVEFFETNRANAFAVNAGVRIGGENIWRFAQKPLNIHTAGKYGDDVISHQVFPGEPVGTFGRLNLRNGGDNWAKDMLRDAMLAPLLAGQAETDITSYRPAVVFLNGRYWGIHDVRKQFDPVFFANAHQLAEDAYDLVQYAHNEAGVTTLLADTGSTDTYDTFHAFYTTRNLSHSTNYSAMQAQMNIDSFIDYVVATDFGVNTSWAHNREFWRARAEGSKWQWNIPDYDRCFDWPNVQGSLIDNFRADYPLFRALDDNTNFVNRLLQRYAAHAGSTFHSNRIIATLDRLAAEVDPEMPRHIARWAAEGGIPSATSRDAELAEIRQFAVARPAYALSRLQTELGLSRGTAALSVNCVPAGGGNVRVAGVPLTREFNSNIGLFRDTPVQLTAEAAPGFAFESWSDGSTNPTIELVLAGDKAISANFRSDAETVLPESINANTVLTLEGSPYTATNDIVVASHVTLTIQAGVEVRMPPACGIHVHGAILAQGASNAPIRFAARDGRSWGNLSFVNATGPSLLSHVVIRDARPSRRDPVNLKASVSGYNSTLTLDHADIDALFPVFTRYGSTTLRDSRIHIAFTGDGINIKSGAGIVENCAFTGTPTPDTDAIDFDSVANGLIRGNRIYTFRGVNSDAIDVGEGCVDLQVVSNRIFNITDKGVSVGQASTAFIYRNLIVDCAMGVGVKDSGSTARVNQNTFARNAVGVAAYEKNAGNGGGIAGVTNCIFYRTKDAPATVDALSSLAIRYSLSDTAPLAGQGNLLLDPKFSDAAIYDFSLSAGSPARNAGDPLQPLDSDGTCSDMGAYYSYAETDYPNLVPNLIVVNEVMAHSHDSAPDWIELHNTSGQPVDVSGWYLSDNADTPLKYRIAEGAIIPGHGYAVFYEHVHFGSGSGDPGALIPFALSENGETVHVFGPGDGIRPDYFESEDFGASPTGVSFGRYYKESSRTFNFVAMAVPTPGAPNSEPLTGPIVISEIMYNPPVGDAEYLELANITDAPVTLFDSAADTPWQMTRGITHVFPSSPPLTLSAGERILLVRNSAVFQQNYAPPAGTRILQWASGGIDNSGESLELSKPGDVNGSGVRQYIRVDRVDYLDVAPWPASADGGGKSLARINERGYGNDFANWTESSPNPGSSSYQQWANLHQLPAGESAGAGDPDDDGLWNALEFAIGTDPMTASTLNWNLVPTAEGVEVMLAVPSTRGEAAYYFQRSAGGPNGPWADLVPSKSTGPGNSPVLSVLDAAEGPAFYRLKVVFYGDL